MTNQETLELALEVLKSATPKYTRQRKDQKTLGGALDYWKLEQHQRLKAIKALEEALAKKEHGEPVAWLHTKIEGVAIPHRPADLDKHPDRWEALYKTPSPCPTCEALARTVMLDQTSHDTTPQQRTWVGLTDEELLEIMRVNYARTIPLIAAVEAKLKEKNT